MIIAFPKKTSEFIDLCVVSNISVLILDDLFHGYYINGQCPSGKSDVPLEKLAEMLEDESQGNIKQRGIGQDDIDTYEIYITHHFRNQYDDLYNLQSGNKPNRRIDQDDETFKYTKKYFKEHNENLDKMRPHEKYNTIGVIRRLLNAEIKENILRVFHEPTKYVKDLTSLMRIFEMPSVELTGNTRDNFVFFKDKNESYTKVLFDGIQWELYVWWVYWFLFVLLLSESVPLGVFCAVCVDYVSSYLRRAIGEKNISKTSLTDDRFVI